MSQSAQVEKNLPQKPKSNIILDAAQSMLQKQDKSINVSFMNYFLMESVDVFKYLVKKKSTKNQLIAQRMLKNLNFSPDNAVEILSAGTSHLSSVALNSTTQFDPDFDEFDELNDSSTKSPFSPQVLNLQNDNELLFTRLDIFGFNVGNLVAEYLSLEKHLMVDLLDIMKFVCKELWQFVFQKQIDNLKTNHKGVYVLQDSSFQMLSNISPMSSQQDFSAKLAPYLAFPCGLIRGSLSSLGVDCTVAAEVQANNQCGFKIEVLNFNELSNK